MHDSKFDQLPGEHQANDKPWLDLKEYHGEIISMKHPSNRRKGEKNEKPKTKTSG